MLNYFVLRTLIRRRGSLISLKNTSQTRIEFVEQLLMTIKTGKSYESAAHEMSFANNLWKKWIQQSENASTYDQLGQKNNEIVQILTFCRKYSSQSYHLLSFFRKTIRQRARLEQKQALMTLQAKAQAIISGLIFAVLVLTQWSINPDFSIFLTTTMGRLVFVACFTFVGLGIGIVFQLSKPREVEL